MGINSITEKYKSPMWMDTGSIRVIDSGDIDSALRSMWDNYKMQPDCIVVSNRVMRLVKRIVLGPYVKLPRSTSMRSRKRALMNHLRKKAR